MSTEARYVPNKEVQGDDRPIVDKGNSRSGEYNKSLGEANRGDLLDGYCGKKGISSDTKSDKGMA